MRCEKCLTRSQKRRISLDEQQSIATLSKAATPLARAAIAVHWPSGRKYHVTKEQAKSLVASGLACWNDEKVKDFLLRVASALVVKTDRAKETAGGLISLSIEGALRGVMSQEMGRFG